MTEGERIKLDIQQFITSIKTAQLATATTTGKPEASYSPFLYRSPDFYIFVSTLAKHTNNLLSNPDCSLMLIEDECKTTSIFGRKRLTMSCRADRIDLTDTEAQRVLDDMATHLGKTMRLIRQLPDFLLFRLRGTEARFVRGFAAAYRANGTLDEIERLTGR